MRQVFRHNGLSISMLGLFLVFQIGLSIVGQQQHNHEQAEHNQPLVSYGEYLTSPTFVEATMENWESEFLQMFAFVLLTAIFYQKGSAESKDPDKPEPVDRHPRKPDIKPDAPWPVRKGGIILRLYENSLGLALLFLFLISFILHAVGGRDAYNQEQLAHGGSTITVPQYITTSQFWFESLQNWQSEFFSVGVLVILTVFLRQKGSSQSKPVDSPHSETGAA